MSDKDTESNPEVVSFAVIAYMQEDSVRGAIQAAFDQTHSPLEIILSDDCSGDRTFEIMEEMAAAYQGPHKIRLNRNEKNLGLIGHVNLLFELAEGTLIIPAAGDDLSMPDRAKILYEAFEKDRPFMMDTPIFQMDQEGNIVGGVHSRAAEVAGHTTEKAAHTMRSVIGASAAWSKEMYDLYGPITEPGTYEDAVFYFRAKLAGRFLHVPEPLVTYQKGGMSWQRAADERLARLKKFRLRVATWKQRRKDLRTFCHHVENKLMDAEAATLPSIERLERLVEGKH
ncbi:glycosyltransferase family 2 protein [Halocynthiibacter styelae]|uniref:Glycosyltransferase family 2 protein n=1 Tax=Halocynthiibacter styelae TaxID=2761955 RepID=A0A8J7LLS3_9RHOB|nr:glycosyltransferase family 2 protein [Paenihalocynthiibacter styelae]MBI1494979.1 glycosyltransferase family 2 protein [Paenihalocynthiibacter styelae]